MRKLSMFGMAILASLTGTGATGASQVREGYAVCSRVITEGLKAVSVKRTSAYHAYALHQAICEGSSVKAGFDSNAAVALPIEGIPVELRGTGNGRYEQAQNFCKAYDKWAVSNTMEDSRIETIADKGYDTFLDCMKIARSGGEVTHEMPSMESTNFFVKSGDLQTVQVDGIRIAPEDAPVQCVGTVPQPGGKTLTQAFTRASTVKVQRGESLRITCTRKPVPAEAGEKLFREAVITVPTELGNYSVVQAQDTRLPDSVASSIAARMAQLQTDLRALAARNPSILLTPTALGGFTGADTWSNCPAGQVVVSVGSGHNQDLRIRCGTMEIRK